MSTMSHRESLHATDTHRVASSAVIGKSVVIKGQIYSREDLVIDGEVEGSVEAHENKIVVGPNGKVSAGVKAREVVVHGAIKGNVEAGEKIDIRREAKLVGDIKTQRIVIEDGAYFKGSVDIQRPDAQKQAAAGAAGATGARPAATAAATGPAASAGSATGTPASTTTSGGIPIEVKK